MKWALEQGAVGDKVALAQIPGESGLSREYMCIMTADDTAAPTLIF
jgi:hypothetical protein